MKWHCIAGRKTDVLPLATCICLIKKVSRGHRKTDKQKESQTFLEICEHASTINRTCVKTTSKNRVGILLSMKSGSYINKTKNVICAWTWCGKFYEVWHGAERERLALLPRSRGMPQYTGVELYAEGCRLATYLFDSCLFGKSACDWQVQSIDQSVRSWLFCLKSEMDFCTNPIDKSVSDVTLSPVSHSELLRGLTVCPKKVTKLPRQLITSKRHLIVQYSWRGNLVKGDGFLCLRVDTYCAPEDKLPIERSAHFVPLANLVLFWLSSVCIKLPKKFCLSCFGKTRLRVETECMCRWQHIRTFPGALCMAVVFPSSGQSTKERKRAVIIDPCFVRHVVW